MRGCSSTRRAGGASPDRGPREHHGTRAPQDRTGPHARRDAHRSPHPPDVRHAAATPGGRLPPGGRRRPRAPGVDHRPDAREPPDVRASARLDRAAIPVRVARRAGLAARVRRPVRDPDREHHVRRRLSRHVRARVSRARAQGDPGRRLRRHRLDRPGQRPLSRPDLRAAHTRLGGVARGTRRSWRHHRRRARAGARVERAVRRAATPPHDPVPGGARAGDRGAGGEARDRHGAARRAQALDLVDARRDAARRHHGGLAHTDPRAPNARERAADARGDRRRAPRAARAARDPHRALRVSRRRVRHAVGGGGGAGGLPVRVHDLPSSRPAPPALDDPALRALGELVSRSSGPLLGRGGQLCDERHLSLRVGLPAQPHGGVAAGRAAGAAMSEPGFFPASAPDPQWWRPEPETPGAVADERPGALAAEAPGAPLAFWALIGFTFVLLIAPQNIFPALQPLRIGMLVAGTGLAAMLINRLGRGLPITRVTREIRIAALLLVWAVVTIPFSYWPGGSINLLTELYLKTLAIFLLIVNVVSTVRRLRIVAWALTLMSVPLALQAVENFIGGVYVRGGVDQAVKRIVGYEAGLTQNPNDLALMLNLIMPLAVALFLTTHAT